MLPGQPGKVTSVGLGLGWSLQPWQGSQRWGPTGGTSEGRSTSQRKTCCLRQGPDAPPGAGRADAGFRPLLFPDPLVGHYKDGYGSSASR